MKRILVFSSATLLMSFIHPVSAEVFERDWKMSGDGLLTYDDVNQREWLDLSVSRLDQFPGVTLEERYQDAIGELASGGIFDGFSVAKQTDVIAFAESAGVDMTTDDFTTNQMLVGHLIDLLGSTAVFSSGRAWSVGFLDEFSMVSPPGSPLRVAAWLDIDPRDPLVSRAALRFPTSVDTDAPAVYGIMLYRQIPEPSSTYFIVFGVFGLAAGRTHTKPLRYQELARGSRYSSQPYGVAWRCFPCRFVASEG